MHTHSIHPAPRESGNAGKPAEPSARDHPFAEVRMLLKYISLSAVFLFVLAAGRSEAATYTVVNAGFTFSPSTLTINAGDTVVFSLDPIHNVVEVDLATWNANGNASNGGFTLPFGGGTQVFATAGVFYYVCAPHASMGMKGSITVNGVSSINTGTLASNILCAGAQISVPYTASGSFSAGNTFSAQLSDMTGSFASPVVIGSVSATTSGSITATIPTSTLPGISYRIRVVSSNPVVIGAATASTLTVVTAPTAVITPTGATSFCAGQSVTLTATAGTSFTYAWSRNGTPIAGAMTETYVATQAGSYTVAISNGNCVTTSAPISVVVFAADPTTFLWTGAQSSDWSTVGNWDSPCAVPSPGDTVIIPGTTAPPVAIPAITLSRLVVSNPMGLTLSGDVQVTGGLTLTQGVLTLGNFNLSIAATATITGGSSSSFIVTNGTGSLRQAGIGTGARAGAVTWPVGSDAGAYTPLVITNAGTADEFGVRVGDGVLAGGTAGAALTSDVVAKTWFITEGTAGGSNATLTFQWDASAELSGFDRTACFVAHHNGSTWEPLQPLGAALAGTSYTRTVAGVSTFSPFAIGGVMSPLPVELRSFTADVYDGGVQLGWETASEFALAGFAIERTAGAPTAVADASWAGIGFIPAQGASGGGARYLYKDQVPAGTWSYRLRSIDHDGSFTYSQPLSVTVGEAAQASDLEIVDAWPNPVALASHPSLTVTYSTAGGPVSLTLYNILGQRLASLYSGQPGAGTTTLRFDATSLPTGMHILRLESAGRIVERRVMVVK